MQTKQTKIRLKRSRERNLPELLREQAVAVSAWEDDSLIYGNKVADLLEEAANKIESQDKIIGELDDIVDRLEERLYEKEWCSSAGDS